MLKLIGKVALLVAMSLPVTAFGSCAEFEAEAHAFDAVIPKFDDNGALIAMLMYGEATFIVPKRSLINDARQKAQMRAKRRFTEFLKSDFSAETLSQDMINTVERTDGAGNNEASAEELSSTLNTMRESSEAVLSGIVKLDECVDSEQKYVMVAMGWKPEYTKAASQAADQTAGEEGALGVEVTEIIKAKGYRKKSKLADDF